MLGTSKTANSLMSWGANVAASQRSQGEEDHDSHWKRAEKLRAGSKPKRGLGSKSSPRGRIDVDIQEQCNIIAQRLIDEDNELQYCEQIFSENEREFEKREGELMQAAAEIQRSAEQVSRRPVAEEVSLREEALWHLEGTLRRLEDEETVQGQAIVALADCVSCCQMGDIRGKELVLDIASFTKIKVIALLRGLREVCVSFETRDGGSMEFFDDIDELHAGELFAKGVTDRPLRQGVIDALRRVRKRCENLRSIAGDHTGVLLDATRRVSEECERQSVTVHHAHRAIEELKQRTEEILSEIESTQTTEAVLRRELADRQHRKVLVEGEWEAQKEQLQCTSEIHRGLEVDISKCEADVKRLKHLLSEHTSARERFSDTLERVESEIGVLQLQIHEGSSAAASAVDNSRDLGRKISQLEIDIRHLEDRLQQVNERDSDVVLASQALHTKVLETVDETDMVGNSQRGLHEEASSLEKRMRDLDVTVSKQRESELSTSDALEKVRAEVRELSSAVAGERAKESHLSSVLQLLKDQLLHNTVRERIEGDDQSVQLVAEEAKQSDVVPPADFHRDVARSRQPPPVVPSIPSQHNRQLPYVESRLENAVSTGPLTHLLLSDVRAPLRVPLEQRGQRVFGQSDAVRDRLMSAFQLL